MTERAVDLYLWVAPTVNFSGNIGLYRDLYKARKRDFVEIAKSRGFGKRILGNRQDGRI